MRDGLWGLVGIDGREIVPVVYDAVMAGGYISTSDWPSTEYVRVVRQGKWGLYHVGNRELIPPIHQFVEIVSSRFVTVMDDGIERMHLVVGDKVVSVKHYDAVKELGGNRTAVSIGGKWGLLDPEGKEVVPPQYDEIKSLHNCVAVRLGDKWGLVDWEGREIVPPRYDRIESFAQGRVKVCVGGKWGLIDLEGKEVVSPQYDDVTSLYNRAAVRLGDKWGLIDWEGREIVPLQYDEISWMDEERAAVRVGGKWGCIDVDGREVVPPRYDEVELFDRGRAPVRVGRKWGFIDVDGKEVVPPRYDEISSFCLNERAPVRVGGRWGFIDVDGREVVPPRYQVVGSFYDGRAEVYVGGRWGFIDVDGKEIVPPRYDEVKSFHDERAAVRVGRKWGFIDVDGKEVVPPQYDEAESFDNNGHAAVCIRGKWGIIDTHGNEIVPIQLFDSGQFTKAILVNSGLVPKILKKYKRTIDVPEEQTTTEAVPSTTASDEPTPPADDTSTRDIESGQYGHRKEPRAEYMGGRWVLIDPETKEVMQMPLRYNEIESFSEGRAAFRVGNKWGFIDRDGNEVVPPRYDKVGWYSEGRAAVCIGGKWGFIDRDGNEVVPLRYDAVRRFYLGHAPVVVGNKWGLIDTEGKEVVPLSHEVGSPCDFHVFSGCGLLIVQYRGPHGWKAIVYDKKYNVVIPPMYSYIEFYDDLGVGRANVGGRVRPAAFAHGKWGIINTSGKQILPLICDMIITRGKDFELMLEVVEDFILVGYADRSGRLMLLPKYWSYSRQGKNQFRVKEVEFCFTDAWGNEYYEP
jgi:hypothetical protein